MIIRYAMFGGMTRFTDVHRCGDSPPATEVGARLTEGLAEAGPGRAGRGR